MPNSCKLIVPTTEGVDMTLMDMVLVLLFAQVLFAYYYIGARLAGLEIVRVW